MHRFALVCCCLALGDAARHRRTNSTGAWQAQMYDGMMKITRPAFLHLHKNNIYVSQFGKMSWIPLPGKSEISTISASDIGGALKKGKLTNLRVSGYITGGLQWPNKLSHAPPQMGEILVIPDGFLVPGKRNGNIFLHKTGSWRNMHRITPKKDGAFYHEVEWHDFDGDGNLDILVPRAIVTGLSPVFRGELMWYRNPGPDKMMKQEWEEHKIIDGPDVICHSRDYQGGLALFCSQFWDGDGKLMVHFLTKRAEHKWSRLIDAKGGKLFSVEMVDVDGDGTDELLVTNHQDKIADSAVFAYEVPWSNLQNGRYTKHVLAINIFDTVLTGPGVASPGFAYAFYPKIGTRSGPKDIIVAGDGSLDVWHLSPKPGVRFGYEPHQVAPPRGTTGELLLHDFDGDGIMDVLVPNNDDWDLTAITFRRSR